MSATPFPLVVEASPLTRYASFPLSGPMPSLASCRGGLAPRCRCFEAQASAGRGFPAGFLLGAVSTRGLQKRSITSQGLQQVKEKLGASGAT
jgi:hypothetical protein